MIYQFTLKLVGSDIKTSRTFDIIKFLVTENIISINMHTFIPVIMYAFIHT